MQERNTTNEHTTTIVIPFTSTVCNFLATRKYNEIENAKAKNVTLMPTIYLPPAVTNETIPKSTESVFCTASLLQVSAEF